MAFPSNPADMQAYILEQLTQRDDEVGELDILYDMLAKKLASILSAEVDAIAPDLMELQFVNHEVTTTKAALADAGDNEAVALVGTSESSQVAIVRADPMAAAILLDASLGSSGEGGLAPMTGPLSPIEVDVFETNADRYVDAMAENGLISGEQQLLFACDGNHARQEVSDFPAVSFSFKLIFGDHTGTLSILISDETLARGKPPAPSDQDNASNWQSNLKAGVMQMNINVAAVVNLPPMTLGQLGELKPGDVVEFPSEEPHEAAISVRAKTLFVGQFGRLGNRYTICVDRPAKSKKNIVDHIMSAM